MPKTSNKKSSAKSPPRTKGTTAARAAKRTPAALPAKPRRAVTKSGTAKAGSTKRAPTAASSPQAKGASSASVAEQRDEALAWLRRHATKATRDGMARYAIPSDNALGVKVGDIRTLGKRLGHSQDLAVALWENGIYEARMLAAFVGDPKTIDSKQMEVWCREFDSWAICDTMCFHLFDRTPHAWKLVHKWSKGREEFVKRAAFALLASLSVHDKKAEDARFVEALPLIERAATDDRNFVKKSVNWALRTLGRRNVELNAAAVAVARRLAESPEAAPRWVGKDALRELTSPAVVRRLSKKRAAA
jgi:3-methyladenine DNA glycosylase AlkD